MNEFEFDDIEFSPEEVEDGILDLQSNNDIDPGFTKLDTDEGEVEINVSLKTQSTAEIAKDVESTLISLLADNDIEAILALTGEHPSVGFMVPDKVASDFSQAYAQATLFNPALKWYSKFAKIFKGSFGVNQGNLFLKTTKSVFNKVIKPFIGDFQSSHKESSPIVELIHSLSRSVEGQDIEEVSKSLETKSNHPIESEEDLDPSEVDFSDIMIPSEDFESDLRVDDKNELGLTEVDFNPNSVRISLADLANKSIAEFFISEGINSESEISERLSSERFQSKRISEIVGIWKYLRLNSSLESKIMPTGRRGSGDVEFDFEV